MRTATRTAVMVAAGLTMAGFVALLAWGLSTKAPVSGLSGITRVREPAPDFTLPLYTDGEVALSEHRGRPIVLNFWASWCAPCRDEAGGLERAWQAYKSQNVLFVGVNIQDAEPSARAYLAELGITYPNGPDGEGRATIDYGVVGIPVTFFINKSGVIEQRYVGAIEEPRLFNWVDALAAGRQLSDEIDVAGFSIPAR